MDYNSFRYGLILGGVVGIVSTILGLGCYLYVTDKIKKAYEVMRYGEDFN